MSCAAHSIPVTVLPEEFTENRPQPEAICPTSSASSGRTVLWFLAAQLTKTTKHSAPSVSGSPQ